MNGLIQWFVRDGERFEPAERDGIDETQAEGPAALPAHVQEFLDLKAAAGF
jgi:hypothetical protein